MKQYIFNNQNDIFQTKAKFIWTISVLNFTSLTNVYLTEKTSLKILRNFFGGDAVYCSEITNAGRISFTETIDKDLRMGTVVTFYQTARLYLAKLGVSTFAITKIIV
jgi:hypothetical protein